MKFTIPLLVVAVAVGLAGCASKKKEEERAECTFPDNPKEKAPSWVCNDDAPIEGVRIWAMGTWQKTGAGIGFQKDQAAAAARVRLAQTMKVTTTAMIKQHAQTTGAGTSETVDQVASSTARLFTSENLQGSRTIRTTYSSLGQVYVVVGMDPEAAKASITQALQTSMNNDRAQWQQYKGAQAQAELSAEIYKMGEQKMR